MVHETESGGSITPGTYHLIAGYFHAGSPVAQFPNKTIKETLTIDGTTLQLVDEAFGNAEIHETWTIVPSGTNPGMTRTCTTDTSGDDAIVWSGYTADDNSITLYSEAFKLGLSYTRQQ